MTYQEYDRKMNDTIRDIQSNGIIMQRLGVSALTLIKERVQEKGVNAENQKFGLYSTKPTLVGCKTFVQKSACQALLGSKPKRKKLEWRTVGGNHLAILPGGYKKIRELQGRQTNHFDMTVTGNTWKDINLISKPVDHQRGVAIIGARNTKYKEILKGNTERRGDILDLSNVEIDKLKESYNLQVLQVFKNHGL